MRRLHKSRVGRNVLLNSALVALPPANLAGVDRFLWPWGADGVESWIKTGCTSLGLLIETFFNHIDVANRDGVCVVPLPYLTNSNVVLIHPWWLKPHLRGQPRRRKGVFLGLKIEYFWLPPDFKLAYLLVGPWPRFRSKFMNGKGLFHFQIDEGQIVHHFPLNLTQTVLGRSLVQLLVINWSHV